MSDLHPHWHTTDEARPAAGPAQAVEAVAAISVSRKPAAIVGILCALTLGFLAFEGFNLLGQLTDSTQVIRITPQGFEPATLTIRPGEKIRWKNEDSIPHIIYSDTLKDEKGATLQTSPIFKDKELAVTLSPDLQGGDYTFGSRTKSAYTGTLTVEIEFIASSSASSSMSTQAFSSVMSSDLFPPVFGTTSFASSVMPSTTDANGIPQNPFTVDSKTAAYVPTKTASATTPPLMQQVKSKPLAQPDSGPAAFWLLGILSAGLLLVVTRKSFIA